VSNPKKKKVGKPVTVAHTCNLRKLRLRESRFQSSSDNSFETLSQQKRAGCGGKRLSSQLWQEAQNRRTTVQASLGKK
jgi:hypothetical protein